MRLLADENFPRPAVKPLRAAGLDVSWIAEYLAGAEDEVVLRECIISHRTLLTFDKDFGELAYRRGQPADCGIVLFRFTPETPEEASEIVLKAIRSQSSWAGFFSVVTRDRIRMRPAPPAGKPPDR
jgi:predicted nuclease of predicted toxin-antitoxin system